MAEIDYRPIDNLPEYIRQNNIQMREASKFARINAVQAHGGEQVITIASDGTQETTNVANQGDWIVNNIGNPDNKWIIDQATFAKKYQLDPTQNGVYMPTGGPMMAGQVNEPISFVAPWGERMFIDAGGYLMQTPGSETDIYGISRADFDSTYRFGKSVSLQEETPEWARYADYGYEVSSAGDARFSALSARFAEGTLLGDIDISGRTVEDVYQTLIKKSSKGLPPAPDSMAYSKELNNKMAMARAAGNKLLSTMALLNRKLSLSASIAESNLSARLDAMRLDDVDLPESLIEVKEKAEAYVSEHAADMSSCIIDRRAAIGTLLVQMQSMVDRNNKIQNEIKEEMEDYSYTHGYRQLWTMWTMQNIGLVKQLRDVVHGRTLTDRFASTRVSQARAFADIFNKRAIPFSAEETKAFFSVSKEKAVSAIPQEQMEGYDIYTLGTGRRTMKEFTSLIPDGVDVIIDTRAYRTNKTFSGSAIEAMAEAQGKEYVWLKGLTGYRKDYASVDKKDSLIYDYVSVAATEEYREALEALREIVAGGNKVLLIGKDSNPAFSDRALLTGQEIERRSALRMAHIDTDPDGGARIRSQEEIIKIAMGYNARINNGDYLSPRFRSDRTYVLPKGVTVERITIQRPVKERLIKGRWNYGSKVTITRNEEKRLPDETAFTASVRENATALSDFTVVFRTGAGDRSAAEAMAQARNKTAVALPAKKEDYYDEARAERAAEMIRRRMGTNFTARYARHGNADFDFNAIRLNVAGSTLPWVANLPVDHTDDVPLSAHERYIVASNTGMKMDDISGITQEDINHYVNSVLSKLLSKKGEFEYQEDAVPYNITRIVSNGQSGVAEAAIIAAQKMKIDARVNAPLRWTFTWDNETVGGIAINDEAAFKNRFHQALKDEVSLANVQAQIEDLDMRREYAQDGMQIGLTDRQMLVLYNLGFNNTDMLEMADLARNNAVSVNSPRDMYDFIGQCAGYGLTVDETVTEEMVQQAFKQVVQQTEEWKAAGITFISSESPYYPENLTRFKDYQDGKRQMTEVEDNVSHIRTGNETVTVQRPAILWCKGDLSLFQSPSVSVTGPRVATEESAQAARFVGSEMAKREVPIIGSLSDGTSEMAMSEALNQGGRVIGVSAEGIDMDVNSTEEELADIEKEIERQIAEMRGEPGTQVAQIEERIRDAESRLEDAGDPDEYQDLQDEIDELESLRADKIETAIRKKDEAAAKKNTLQRNPSNKRDRTDEIRRKGGLVVSPNPPVEKGKKRSSNREDRTLAGIVSTTLGYTCVVIDSIFNAQPMSPLAMAAYSIYGVLLLSAKGLDKIIEVKPEQKTEQKPEQKAEGQGPQESNAAGELENAVEGDLASTPVHPMTEETADIIADQAHNNFEAGPDLDIPDLQIEPQKRLRNIPSFFESIFSAQTEDDDEKIEEPEVIAPAEELRQAPIEMIRSTYDDRRIFIVPVGHPEIEKALHDRFDNEGEVIIGYPQESQFLKDSINHHSIMFGSVRIDRFTGYTGTEMQQPESYVSSVYYFHGEIKTLTEMPNGVAGLPSREERIASDALFHNFRADAQRLQARFQKDTGYDGEGAIRYAKADYLVIKDTSVEIRRGDEIRAKVWLDMTGRIHARNFSIAEDDYHEYHEMQSQRVFDKNYDSIKPADATTRQELLNYDAMIEAAKASLAEADEKEKAALKEKINSLLKEKAAMLQEKGGDTFENLLVQLESTLYSRGLDAMMEDTLSLVDRENAEERRQAKETGHHVDRRDNWDIATEDVAKAMNENRLYDTKELEPLDKTMFFAIADRNIADNTAAIERLTEDITQKMKILDSIYDNSPLPADDEAEQQEEAQQSVIETEDKTLLDNVESEDNALDIDEISPKGYILTDKDDARRDLEFEVSTLVAKKEGLIIQNENMKDLKEALAFDKEALMIKEDKASSSVLIAGYKYSIRNYSPTREELEQAQQNMKAMRSQTPTSTNEGVLLVSILKDAPIEEGIRDYATRLHSKLSSDPSVDVSEALASVREESTLTEAASRMDACLSGALQAGLLAEVLESTQVSLQENGDKPLLEALEEGCREWDIQIAQNIKAEEHQQEAPAQQQEPATAEKTNSGIQLGSIEVVNVREFGGPEEFEKSSKSNVYIGRRPGGNILGNPYTHLKGQQTLAKYVVSSREESVKAYEKYFTEKYGTDPEYTEAIDALKNRMKEGENLSLGCWCKPLSCHGDIIKQKIEQMIKNELSIEASNPQQKADQTDILIVKSEQGAAYVNSDGKRISDFYQELMPMGKNCGIAVRKDGDTITGYKVISLEGKEITTEWVSKIKREGDSYTINYAEGGLNILEKNGQLRFPEKLVEMFDETDGLRMVKDAKGHYNYLTRDNMALLDHWVDEAVPFENGNAIVKIKNTCYKIDKDGINHGEAKGLKSSWNNRA